MSNSNSDSNSKSQSSNPFVGYRFTVEIDSITVGGFSEVDGLEMQRQTIEYREGGVNDHVHKLPGQVAYSNLVLRRGLTNDVEFWKWIEKTKNGMDAKGVRKNMRVVLQDTTGTQAWGWEFANAYPVRWSGPAMQSRDGAIAIETVEFAHDGFSKIMPK